MRDWSDRPRSTASSGSGRRNRREVALEFLACRGAKQRFKEMNDASTRFAADQTGAATLLRGDESDARVVELAESAVELNAWATEEGLRGATARELFDGYCRRLSALNVVIVRAYVSTQTLHPQWSGYGYTWRRDLNSVREQQYARGPASQEWLSSPFNALIERSRAGEKNPWLRRRLELGPDQRDFPALVDFYEAGATDYLCLAFAFGEAGDPSHGTGVVYSFTTDRPGGFHAAEIHLLRSTLPGLSLAMKAHAGYDIASGLLRTYLGHDAGSRVHSGAVERGTVDSLHSVFWYADLRGFTRISDVSPGAEIVQMLNDCEPLSRQILFSSRFAEAAGRCDGRLGSLGQFQLRGVDEAKEIFGPRLSQTAALQLGQA